MRRAEDVFKGHYLVALDNFIAAVRRSQNSGCISVFYVLWLVFPVFPMFI